MPELSQMLAPAKEQIPPKASLQNAEHSKILELKCLLWLRKGVRIQTNVCLLRRRQLLAPEYEHGQQTKQYAYAFLHCLTSRDT